MKTPILTGVALVIMIVVFVCGLCGCAPKKDDGSIPLTTKSKKAKQYYLQGIELADKLQAQDALGYFEKAVAEDPDFALAWLNLAFAQPTFKDFYEKTAKALALVDKVSEGEALMIKAADAASKGQIEEETALYQQLAAKYPSDKRAHSLLANVLMGQQQYLEAIDEYRKALEIDSTFSPSYNQMGYCHRFLGQYNEAEKSFKKYIELIPNDPNPYDSYAELLMKMGRYEESIPQYEKALSLNPNFVSSYIGIATDLNYLNRFKEARSKLQELFDKARHSGEKRSALFSMAISFVLEGNYDAAVAKIRNMLVLSEENADPTAVSLDLNTLGGILLEQGKIDEAAEAFQKSLETYEATNMDEALKVDTRREHLFNMARVASAKGDNAAAQALCDSLQLQIEPLKQPLKMYQVHELGGLVALGAKDYPKAVEELSRANQENPYILYKLALAYQGLGDKENTRNYCAKVFNFNALNSLNYAFVKAKAQQMMGTLA